MRVSFVIPAYQEEAAVAAFRPLLADLPASEILFVDDGSTDGTAVALAALAEVDPRVRIVSHATNQGVGAAMRTGLAAATGEVLVVYDVDRTYPIADAAALIAAVDPGAEGGADIATATPFGPDGGGLEDVPAARSFLSRAAATAYRVVLGRRAGGLSVFTCAFRAYRRETAHRLVWHSDGFPAAAEMLGRALLAGAHVVERPSRLGRRTEGTSKMRVLPTTLGHLGVLARLLGVRLTAR